MRPRVFMGPPLVEPLHMVLVYSTILHSPTGNHPYTQPFSRDPLNFGLDQRERDVLLAVDQAQIIHTPAVPVESDYDDCSLPSMQSESLSTVYAQQRDHASHINNNTAPTHPSTTRVLRTPLEFYTAATLNDPIAEDPYTYGTSVQPSSPRQLVYPRVSTETTLRALREANSPPPAHCTLSKTDSYDSRRG